MVDLEPKAKAKLKPKAKEKAKVVTSVPDHRTVLPADEYKRRIQALHTSAQVQNFRGKFKRGE